MIGLDLMGGDRPPEELLEGILEHFPKIPFRLALLATPDVIKKYADVDLDSLDIELIPCEDFIALDEDPLSALRSKKHCSTLVAMRLLLENRLDAFISIGNTGALFGAAKFKLGTIKGISRPALLTLLPTLRTPVAVLDVGANIHCKPDHFLQFAKMGIAHQKKRGVRAPRVGLLNIGNETTKGRKEIREAHKKLTSSLKSQFIGNIEPQDAFAGEVDVLVTDGYTGNIFLKTAEATSQLMIHKLKIKADKEVDKDAYPGAVLAGLNHLVIKCHSSSSPRAIASALGDVPRIVSMH